MFQIEQQRQEAHDLYIEQLDQFDMAVNRALENADTQDGKQKILEFKAKLDEERERIESGDLTQDEQMYDN